ncbi:unnamed protein product, partial [marine sediment metagenome]
WFYGLFRLTGANLNATATDNTEDPLYNYTRTCSSQFRIGAGINNSKYGLVVGTGVTDPTNTDYKLATQLTEGVGVGNITHGAVTVGPAGIVGVNVEIETERPFTNNTGSTITIKEAGVYVGLEMFDYYHCIIRDVLETPVVLPNRCSLTVYYTFRTTV